MRPLPVSVCVAWLTFVCTFGLTQALPAALNSKITVAALSVATVAVSAAAVLLHCGTTHAVYVLVPVLVATHSMVPIHAVVACLATVAILVVHFTTLMVEIQWSPSTQHVKQVSVTKTA